jgi:hypothetical protein
LPGTAGLPPFIFFSTSYPELDSAVRLHLLALEQETSLQALMGEAFDDLMRKYGKHPFGER